MPHRWLMVLACLWVATAPSRGATDHPTQSVVSGIGLIQGQLEKSAELATPLCPGGNIRYTLTLRNLSDLTTGVLVATLSDPIPAGTTYVQGSASGGAFFDGGSLSIRWNGVLAPGQQASVGFSVTVDAGVASGTVITNSASGTLGQLALNVDLQVTVDCPSTFTLEVSHGSSFFSPLCPGSRIDYRTTLTNTSDLPFPLEAEIQVPVPSETSFLPGSEIGGGTLFPLAPPNADLLGWSGELDPGESKMVGFSVVVDEDLPNGAQITSEALGHLTHPSSTVSIEDRKTIRDSVQCVREVVSPKTWVDLTVFLFDVHFVNDMDDKGFPPFIPGRGRGDMYFAWWANLVGDERREAQSGASKEEIKINDDETFGVTQALFQKKVCCAPGDCPIPPLEIYLDFWDDDDSTAAKIYQLILGLAELVASVDQRADKAVSGLELIGEAADLANFEKKQNGEGSDRHELGVFRHLALPPPAQCVPPPGQGTPCTTPSGEAMEGVVCTQHDVFLKRGAGEDNGYISLAWRAFDTGQACNLATEEGDEQSSVPQLRRASTYPGSAEELVIETEIIHMALANSEPIEVRTRIEPPPASSPAPLSSGLTLPGTVPTAFRVVTRLVPSVAGGGDPFAPPEVHIQTWDGSDWVESGLAAVGAEVVGDHLRVAVDHRDVGNLQRFATFTEVTQGGSSLGSLPADPGELRLVDWLPDSTPPKVLSVLRVPAEGEAGARGQIEKLEILFSEPIVGAVEDIFLDPEQPFELRPGRKGLGGTLLSFTPTLPLPPGHYLLTFLPTFHDVAGNGLDGDGDGVPGDAFELPFEILPGSLVARDAAGNLEGVFDLGEAIFASGEGLTPGSALDLYLIADDTAGEGVPLVDLSQSGPTAANVSGSGLLPLTDLSPATAPGELSLVADLNRDGVFQPQTDLLWDPRGIGVNVLEGPTGTCTPGPETLCLNGGRFQVEATWATSQGTQGTGRQVPLTSDTGYLWFFNPDNVELVVKVLDACSFADRFWVFAGGLTDVAVDLVVTDTLTGTARTYMNALGSAFQPIQDTDAFATCMPGGNVVSRSGAEGSGGAATAWQSLRSLLEPDLGASLGLAAGGAFVPFLPLDDGRFRVEVAWTTAQGGAGEGEPVALTRDTGYFWFFGSTNVEMVIKVLDACSFAGRFWVFAAGLTDVGVEVRVTDTQEGVTKTYRNPLGTAFQPIQDTDAFATCP